METYRPNHNLQGNETEHYESNQQYSYGGSQQYSYDSSQQGAYQNPYGGEGYSSYNASDFMDMNSGFEAADEPVLSGIGNLKSILAEEVVAKSFLFMVVALVITAGAAFTTSPAVAIRMMSGYNFFILLFAELGIVALSNWAISKNNAILAGVLFAVYSYLTGATFSVLFVVYTGESMVSIFMITAAVFGVMAVYGLVTKRDLTSIGSLCLMSLIGIILAGVVNLLIFRNTLFDTILCAIGIFIFVGLIAYDAQKIKNIARNADEGSVLSLAMFGAFELYLDFINLVLKLLRLFGKRK